MIAGVSFLSSGVATNTPPTPPDAGVVTLSVTGMNAGGGYIDLTQGPGIAAIDSSSTGGNGGNITMIAVGGLTLGSGQVLLPAGSSIKSEAANQNKYGTSRLANRA